MKTTYTQHILFLLFLFIVLQSTAQNLRFKQYNLDNGLPSNQVKKTQIDKNGYLWIQTFEGISRFDGTTFKHFDWLDIPLETEYDKSPFTLEGDRLYHLDNNQVSYTKTNCTSQYTQEIVQTKDAVFIHHINQQNASELIVFSKDSCFTLSINPKDSLLQKKPVGVDLPSERPLNFQIGYYSESEFVINIPQKGLYKVSLLDDLSLQYIPLSIDKKPNHIGIQSTSIQEGIWFAKNESLFKWGEDFEELEYKFRYDLSNITNIKSNGYNVFFSDKNRLFKYDLGSNAVNKITNLLNIKSDINHLELDKEDNLWVSTESDGLYCIYHTIFSGYNIGTLGTTPINHLYSTYSLGLLAGTDDGLYLITSGWSKIPLYPTDETIKVFHIGENEDGIIYVSTDHGIYSITQGNPNNCFPKETNINNFLVDDQGYVSFVRDGLLYSYGGCNSTPKAWPLTGTHKSNIIIQDDSSKVWMGTNEGLLIYEKGNVLPKEITSKEGLPHDKINDIKKHKDNSIFIATDKGISIINPYTFSINNITNLPSLKCRKIAISNDNKIWVYSLDGIFSFDISNPENTQKLGIPVVGVNSLEIDKNNKLWIGTKEGLLGFDTKNTFQEEEAPFLYWDKVLLNNENIDIENKDIIIYNNNPLDIEYGAIVFKDNRLASYQYRLNKNDNWQNTKNRNLVFTNLKSGHYNLQIRVQKPNSPWSSPLELPFSVKPPLWQRTGFIACCILGCLALLALFFYGIRAREKKKIETKRRFAELELKALQSQMNPHFIFNTLNAIQHAILKGNTRNANASLNDFSSLMRLYLESSQRKYISLKDEISILQLYCDLTRICYEQKFDYTIKVDPIIDIEDTEIPSMLIQPHVENAIKHGLLPSKEKGSLDIDFSLLKNNQLVCTIKDDGIGRKQAAKLKQQSTNVRSSVGNILTSERANILNEIYRSDISIKITDLKGRRGNPLGTDVKITIPLD